MCLNKTKQTCRDRDAIINKITSILSSCHILNSKTEVRRAIS